jgi:hypothetical protein
MPSVSIERMHRLLLLSLGLAACASVFESAEWEKPGADKAAINRDMSDCSAIANQKAQVPPVSYAGPFYGGGAASAMYQQGVGTTPPTSEPDIGTNRSITRTMDFVSCMQGKGYVRRTASPSKT